MYIQKNIYFISFFLISWFGFSQNNDAEMEILLEERRSYNKSIDSDEGYRIQIFNNLSESKARSVQSKFNNLFPEIPAYLSYDQPDWKVRVGNYKTEADVLKDLYRIRNAFPGAFKLKVKIKNTSTW